MLRRRSVPRPSRPTPLLLVLFGAALLTPASAAGMTVLYLDLDELFATSDAVARVRVMGHEYGRLTELDLPYTDVWVDVLEPLTGDVSGTLRFRRIGGKHRVPGVAPFPVGEESVVFLRATDDGWWIAAHGQSKFTLEDGPDGTIATREVTASPKQRDGDGRLVPRTVAPVRLSLDDLRTRVPAHSTSGEPR